MYFERVTRDQLNLIYNDINTTAETIKKDVNYLMEWMKMQPHLPNITDENLLSNVIIRCKNRLEFAKQKLNSYYMSRAIIKDIFTDRDPTTEEYIYTMKFICCAPMPDLTQEGDRIVICQFFRNFDNILPDITVFLKAVQMQLDVSLKEDISRKAIFVYDFENVTTAHIGYLLTIIKRYISLLKVTICNNSLVKKPFNFTVDLKYSPTDDSSSNKSIMQSSQFYDYILCDKSRHAPVIGT